MFIKLLSSADAFNSVWYKIVLFGIELKRQILSFQEHLTLYKSNKNFDITKLKAFADDKSNIAKIKISLFDRVENTVGKGENAGYQHFLLFPQCFQKSCSLGSLEVEIVW